MFYLHCVFFFFGILSGNLNAKAMELRGQIAGLGSALVVSVSTLMSAAPGVVIANAYNGTIYPLVIGFAIPGLAGLLIIR